MQTLLARSEDFETGYLAGLVDGEGCIFVSFDKSKDRTIPRLRIFGTSKPIIDAASRIMMVNTHPRRDHGVLKGWNGASQGWKAIEAIRRIAPYLTDPSKKCRALTILKKFNQTPSLRGKRPSSELFAHCPPPVKSQARVTNTPRQAIDLAALNSKETFPSPVLPLNRFSKPESIHEMSILANGWLCGMIDGEGYIHVRYRSDRDSMYPRLRVFVKSRPIIDTVGRLLGVNPYARRERGKHKGWYASVSHQKALKILRLIGMDLVDPSKRCRAQRILEAFRDIATIHSRIATLEFFDGCPPPSRIRKSGRVISGR